MTRLLSLSILPALAAFVVPTFFATAARAEEPQLAHMVFFTLKDHSKESRAKFVASCKKYLSKHEGTVYFSVGTIAEDADIKEPVSVDDFDVALHVVFENKGAKLKYLKNPRHDQFVEENKAYFAKVRVFDSFVEKP